MNLNIIKRHYIQVIIFILFVGLYSSAINLNNFNNIILPFMGTEAIVERGHFYLEGSQTPGFSAFPEAWADMFLYKEHIYSNKQPGVYFINSIPYFFLHKLGISFLKDRNFTAGLVTLFTSVLMMSLMMVMLFNVVFKIVNNLANALLITIFCGLGTLIFPYTGVTHHDIYATFFLFLSFYFLFLRYHIKANNHNTYIALGGFFVGFSSFISFNVITIMLVLFLYIFSHKELKETIIFLIFLGAGLLPTLIFNFIVFDHPLNFSTMIYGSFHNMLKNDLSLENTLASIMPKLDAYLFSPITAITYYSPIFLISYFGFILLPQKYAKERVILPLAFLFQFFQPFIQGSLGGFGWCQYGSRYLLECTPFTLIGLAGFFTKDKGSIGITISKYRYLFPLILFTGILSIIICSIGTMGIVYCGYYTNAFLSYLTDIISGKNIPNYSFFLLGIQIIVAAFLLFYFKYPIRTKKVALYFFDINKNEKIQHIYLFLVMLIAFLLRVINLNKIPFGLSDIESFIGYNSFCISETGKDMLGRVLPFSFEFLGSHVYSAIIYISSILIRIFGPEIFTIRFTACLLGLLTIYFTYKLTKLYFSTATAILATLFLTISPWHIYYSRVASESICLPAFFVLGFYLFSLGLKEKPLYIILSSIPIAISFYTHKSALIFVPLFYLFFYLSNSGKIKQSKQPVITCVILVLVMIAPLFYTTKINLFSGANINSFIGNYIKHFSLDFLLKSGDLNLAHGTGNHGQLFWFIFFMSLVGFVRLVSEKKLELKIFPAWLLLFPVASSIFGEGIPNSSNSICSIPVFEILSSVGLIYLVSHLEKTLIGNKIVLLYISVLLLIALGLSSFNNYIKNYFINYPQKSKVAFDYKTYTISKATENLNNYDMFVVPFDFQSTTLLYLQKISPKLWLDKHTFKYVNNDFPINNYITKKIARIVEPGTFSNEEAVSNIYDEPSNQVIYEIKEVKKPSLKDTSGFSPISTGGLKGNYYNGKNFDQLRLTRTDPVISFNWDLNRPDSLVAPDDFGVWWSGWVNIKQPGTYKFITDSDDGVRLKIDDKTIINNWKSNISPVNEGSINLTSGWHIIQLEYFEDTWYSHIALQWETPYNYKGFIPQDLLSPDSIFSN